MNDKVSPNFTRSAFAAGSPDVNLADDGQPVPIPASQSAIHLPADQYLHLGAPTEWWWHIGTLKCGDRVFGFEINAASFSLFGFTQIMLTDVQNKAHYQQSTPYFPPVFNPNTWAESDPSKDWNVTLGEVTMHARQSDPTNMNVTATFTDKATGTVVNFDLTLSQEGAPFLVWGTGVLPPPPPDPTLQKNNFYYSLTRLHASGTIAFGGETHDVTGVTWMDHEYGFFGTQSDRPKWILQDMQLENGICIQNYSTDPPELNQKCNGKATLQMPDGTTYFTPSTITPTQPWTSPETQITYFMKLEVEIPAFNATFVVTSLVDSQEFPGKGGSVYEGVSSAEGMFEGKPVSGTAWNEQALPNPPSPPTPPSISEQHDRKLS